MHLTQQELIRSIQATAQTTHLSFNKLGDLQRLYDTHRDQFDILSISALLTELANISAHPLCPPNQKLLCEAIFLQALNRYIELGEPRGNPQACVKILSACAKARIQHEQLIDILKHFVRPAILSQTTSEDCIKMSLSLLKLNLIDMECMAAILARFKKIFLAAKNIYHFMDMLYVISNLFILKPEDAFLLQKDFQLLLNKGLIHDLTIPLISYNNFWIFLSAFHHGLLPSIQATESIADPGILETFTRLTEGNHLPEKSSEFEKEWQQSIQHCLRNETILHNVYKGAFQLDTLVNGKYNIEIDGPQHYLKQTDHYELKVQNQVRDKLLAKLDIIVIRLPFYELNQLQNRDIDAYLQEKLRAIVNPVSKTKSILDVNAPEFHFRKPVAIQSVEDIPIDTSTSNSSSSSSSLHSDSSCSLTPINSTSSISFLLSLDRVENKTNQSTPPPLHEKKSKEIEFKTVPDRPRRGSFPMENRQSVLHIAPAMYSQRSTPVTTQETDEPKKIFIKETHKKPKGHAHVAPTKRKREQQTFHKKTETDLLPEEFESKRANRRSCPGILL